MPGYQRFVTYMFQYENEKKKENCGFAKVEVRQGQCRIQIQIKGMQKNGAEVYLLYGSSQKPKGIYIGELQMKEKTAGQFFQCEAEDVCGTQYSIREIRGIYVDLPEKGHTFIASLWDDHATEWKNLRLLKSVELKEETVSGQSRLETEETQEVQKESLQGELHATQQERELTVENAEPFMSLQNEMPVLPDSERKSSCPIISAWEKQWKRFTAAHSLFCPFDEDGTVYAVRLQLQDFKVLPKQYQYLANNSFLLHGYFNYKMVLFGYMEAEQRQWFLGVPGVFSNQEQLMAGIFGFPEFRTKQMTRQKTGEFGYWYRFIEI